VTEADGRELSEDRAEEDTPGRESAEKRTRCVVGKVAVPRT